MKKAIKIIAWIVGSLLGLVVVAIVAVMVLLTPARLTPLVNEYASRFIDARVSIDTVELEWWAELPMVSLRLRGARVMTNAFRGLDSIPAAADTLVRLDELLVSLNTPPLLLGKVEIRRVRLSGAHVYTYVSEQGRASWDIFSSDSTASETTASSLAINVERFILNHGGTFVYNNVRDSIYASLDFGTTGGLRLSGNLTPDTALLRLRQLSIGGAHIVARQGGELLVDSFLDSLSLQGSSKYIYQTALSCRTSLDLDSSAHLLRGLPLRLGGGVTFDSSAVKGIAFNNFKVAIDSLEFGVDGHVGLLDDTLVAGNLCLSGRGPIIGRLPYYMPFVTVLSKIESDISMTMEVDVNGKYNAQAKLLPAVELSMSSHGGYLGLKGVTTRLDDLTFNLRAQIDPQVPKKSFVEIEKFHLGGFGVELSGKLRAEDLLGDINFNGHLKGEANISTLSELLPSEEAITAQGIVKIESSGRARLSALMNRNFEWVDFSLALAMDSLTLAMPSEKLHLNTHGARINIGSNANRRDTIMAHGRRAVGGEIIFDTLSLQWGVDVDVRSRGLRASTHVAASMFSRDSLTVHPSSVRASAARFEIRGLDSSFIRTVNLSLALIQTPSDSNKCLPVVELDGQADHLSILSRLNSYRMRGIDAQLRLAREPFNPEAQVVRRGGFEVSLPRGAFDTKDDVDFVVPPSLRKFLSGWVVTGHLNVDSGTVVSPFMPLKTSLLALDMRMTPSQFWLKNTLIRVGESNLRINAVVSDLKGTLMGRNALKAHVELRSDTLNFNELIRAMNIGARSWQQRQELLQSIDARDDNEQLREQALAQRADSLMALESEGSSPLVVVPSNLDLSMGLRVGYALYGQMVMDSMRARVLTKDRALQLKDFYAHTNAGTVELHALYATRSREDIRAGFDMELRNIQVDKFIEMFPAVDSLLPMLASFEGLLDCDLAVTTALDTMMNIVLPSLEAASHIHGKDMVLLDGETFATISKAMFFKKQARNIINNISADILVRNSQIELFPFVMEIDRYQAAISGVHKLDMSFNYHISVLRSPLPFRLGLNVYGTLDDWHFNIGRARYRQANIPSYVQLIDTTRMNLRTAIVDVFRRGVDQASLDGMQINIPQDTLNSSLTPTALNHLTTMDSLAMRKAGALAADTFISTDKIKTEPKKGKAPKKFKTSKARHPKK
ncbi:MAG: AsmA family protein [Mucinivorans sp.]